MNRAGSKRKRPGTSTSLDSNQQQPPSESSFHSHLPSDVINPLSHTPSTLSQFLIAGLPDSEEIPSRHQPDFPHRPWRDPLEVRRLRRRGKNKRRNSSTDTSRRGSLSGNPRESSIDSDGFESFYATTDGEEEGDEDADRHPDAETSATKKQHPGGPSSSLPRPKSYVAERVALRPLARSIAVFLSRDDVPSAKRAFGLLMRSRVSGKPVDIRRHHYWELGAEILMRERLEGEDEEDDEYGHEHENGKGDSDDEGGAKRGWDEEGNGTKQELGYGGDSTNKTTQRRKKRKKKKKRQRPLYPFANIPRVKAYFNELALKYPYHLSARKSASALQFRPAMFSYEIYQAHAQHLLALERLEAEEARGRDEGEELREDGQHDDDDDILGKGYGYGFETIDGHGDEMDPGSTMGGSIMFDGPDGLQFEGNSFDYAASYANRFRDDGGRYHGNNEAIRGQGQGQGRATASREKRLRRAKAELRAQMLETMRGIVERMDRLLEDLPFSRSTEVLRLAGIAWLYVADLLLAPSRETGDDEPDYHMRLQQRQEAETKREAALASARRYFEKVEGLGGEVDDAVRAALDMEREEEESEDEAGLPVFSSLPIRDHRPLS